MPIQDTSDPAQAFALPSFRSLYALTFLVALLVAADILLGAFGYDQLRNPFGVNLSLIAAVLGGARIVYSALIGLLEREVGADLALAIAMVAALLLREYFVAAEVVLIAMVGESLEAIVFSRTNRELERIFELQPRTVHLLQDGQTLDVAIDDVQAGQTVVVRPGERIPVDGTVSQGRSCVDQSSLTGESLPIDKGVDDSVYAGTINQFGALDVVVAKVGDQTTLGHVMQMVAEARRNKSQVERIADRLARYFLPFVLLLAAGTFVATNYRLLVALLTATTADEGWVWMPTLAVLVVTCPCALILATPAAVMAALAWLARRGVLTTGGAALERLASVKRIALDKTGTLTEGHLQLGDVIALDQATQPEVLRWAASAEQQSEHLIAQTIVRAALDQAVQLVPVDEFQALPGAGVSARVASSAAGSVDQPASDDFDALLVGNRRLVSERGLQIDAQVDAAIARLEEAAQSPLLVCRNDRIVGVIGVRDTVRPEAAEVVSQLRQLGIEQIALLTGDRQSTAGHVAATVGIDLVQAELRPDEKAEWIASWSDDESAESRPVPTAMVGDGVNDAPALARADVGIALGGVGSDIAAEAGDLILMGEPLKPLPGLIRLSRQTVHVIRQNIILFAFVVNFLGIVLTAWIMPTWSEAWLKRSPVAAALFHQIGSLLVLLNSMRLLWFDRWEQGLVGRLELAVARWTRSWANRFAPLVELARIAWQLRWQLVRVAGLLLLALYLTQIVIFVQPDEVAVVKRFGRFRAVLPPGPHLRLPPPWDSIQREKPARVRTVTLGLSSSNKVANIDELVEQEDVIQWNTEHGPVPSQSGALQPGEDEALMLTGDKKLAELAATVQYRISDLERYHFGVRNPDQMLEVVVESVIREIVATKPLLRDKDQVSDALEILTIGRGPLEAEVRQLVQARCDQLRLGIELLPQGICLQEVHPPRMVVSAFRDVSSAFKEKARMKSEGEAYYREQLISAAGNAAWSALADEHGELNDQQMARLWDRLRGQQIEGQEGLPSVDEALLAGQAAVEMNIANSFAAEQSYVAQGNASRFQLQQTAHAGNPGLTEWRMFLDALVESLPGKKKLILDQQQGGRRHLMIGFPKESPSQLLPVLQPEPAEHE